MVDKILEIRRRMAGQDNRATAEPIYYVMEKRKIYGVDGSFHDVKFEQNACEDCIGEINYIEIDVVVQPFFSFDGAVRYIKGNEHNMNEPFVHVGSAYRNDEWIAARRFIEGG